MKNFKGFIDIVPRAKARPRFTSYGRPYTPATTKQYEAELKAKVKAMFPNVEPLDGPVFAHLVFHVPRPPSAKKRKYPHTKPDIDNLTKAVFDAFEKVVFVNDSRIILKICQKKYTENRPGVSFYFSEFQTGMVSLSYSVSLDHDPKE